jgi:hypothetical protein
LRRFSAAFSQDGYGDDDDDEREREREEKKSESLRQNQTDTVAAEKQKGREREREGKIGFLCVSSSSSFSVYRRRGAMPEDTESTGYAFIDSHKKRKRRLCDTQIQSRAGEWRAKNYHQLSLSSIRLDR